MVVVVVVDLFIYPAVYRPEWIMTAAGLFYIYDRNPIPGPPFFSSISSFLFPTSAFSSNCRWGIVTTCLTFMSQGTTTLLFSNRRTRQEHLGQEERTNLEIK